MPSPLLTSLYSPHEPSHAAWQSKWRVYAPPFYGHITQHGSHIYTQVGCGHDRYLFHPSPHLSMAVDLVAEEPTA
jgi:hypothetical protein